MSRYQPPLTLTPSMLALVAEISEQVGRLSARHESTLTPQLRRGNRIRTIQASLAIENNTLSIEQVTAVLDGRRVLGLPREIQEVRNAFAAYEAMSGWQPSSRAHLLGAHGLLMHGLIDDAGQLRRAGVGIYREERLVHMAPPPSRVPTLVDDLLNWLSSTDLHPLLASCVFHYEFEFIHPFADGNGRMGRLWQTLILSLWRPVLAWLPVETVIREQQDAYYAALSAADQQTEATPFVEFMLQALQQALLDSRQSDQVTDQVSDQVARLLHVLDGSVALKAGELMQHLQLVHRPTFRNNYLAPALAAGLIEMTDPDSPRSPVQKYRLTAQGARWVASK
ncbi:Fic family protein [Pseudomonas chlororaphis]|uniref:Fic family protein n=1 Tax=Pseudomonas chlororaphis TaxID=587753 RepID=UPI0006A65556|nr:Fic family protein [Pseudomonas chlororaphis]AZC30467.1 Fic domain protein [Pseudomonas chlororaphis subsp. piscium]WDG79102.1 Fic family protein [Pseudomonas chlororaphis]WDG88117.1 Fic family protein [Pseudomonas chlororaphis]WDG94376.1 Fic family protein [Pseudomonas chlororaphis]SDT17104.1 Fic family protein [Pseudomonas chlororaphis]